MKDASTFLSPKEIEIKYTLPEGGESSKKFVISMFPALDGREILTKYPQGLLMSAKNYEVSREMLLKVMTYCAAVLPDGAKLVLESSALIENHCPTTEVLIKLEKEVILYNTAFFFNARTSNFLKGFLRQLEDGAVSALTRFAQSLSQQTSQPSES